MSELPPCSPSPPPLSACCSLWAAESHGHDSVQSSGGPVQLGQMSQQRKCMCSRIPKGPASETQPSPAPSESAVR